MVVLPICVHEMFYPLRSAFARHSPIAQVADEPRIARGETAELGPRHVVGSQESLDFSKQVQGGLPMKSRVVFVLCSVSNPTCL